MKKGAALSRKRQKPCNEKKKSRMIRSFYHKTAARLQQSTAGFNVGGRFFKMRNDIKHRDEVKGILRQINLRKESGVNLKALLSAVVNRKRGNILPADVPSPLFCSSQKNTGSASNVQKLPFFVRTFFNKREQSLKISVPFLKTAYIPSSEVIFAVYLLRIVRDWMKKGNSAFLTPVRRILTFSPY